MRPYGELAVVLCCITLVAGISHFPLLLVVSLDGFWAGYLEQYKNVTPNLWRLAETGVRAPWMENVFITKTLPNHHSIVTGLYEESHGIVANEFYDPVLKEKFEPSRTEAKWWDTGSIPIWILNQMADSHRFSGGMMWPGSNANIRNQTAFYFEPYYEESMDKENIDKIIKWFTNETSPANCVFLYIPEPDETGHKYGPNSIEMKEAVANVDNTIGYLENKLKEASLFSKMNIIIVSDHGMAEVTPERVFDIDRILNHSFTAYGSSPVWEIYPDEGKENFVYDVFTNASISANGKIKIWKKEEIPLQFHYRNNVRIAPMILVAEEGYDIVHCNEMKNKTGTYGNHGYNNSAISMHSLFIARGPAFKEGIVIPPFRNFDLYPLMCQILHLMPEKNNGSLRNVVKMLQHPFGLHITNKWLIVICSILAICVLVAVVSAFVANKGEKFEQITDRGFSGSLFRKDRNKEENTYLLVTPSATDEV